MIGIPGVRAYYLYRAATDMRKSFSGLCGLVINEMGRDVLSGDGFIFINKRRTLIKILVWDRTGYVIYYKKLSSGTLELPDWSVDAGSPKLELSTLFMMLEGVEMSTAKLRKRYMNVAGERA